MGSPIKDVLNAFSVPAGICSQSERWLCISQQLNELLTDAQREDIRMLSSDLILWEQMWRMAQRNRRFDMLSLKLASNLENYMLKSARLQFDYDPQVYFLLELHPIQTQIESFSNLTQSYKSKNRMEHQILDAKVKTKVAVSAAMTDPLTKLPNRRQFEQILNKLWGSHQQAQQMLGLLIVDIDFFKDVNDSLGHAHGDQVLKEVANILKQTTEASAKLVARIGGEEFAILLANSSENHALSVCNNLIASMAAHAIPHPTSRVKPYVTVSIGACVTMPSSLTSISDLLHSADKSLYVAKQSGRNHHHLSNRITPAFFASGTTGEFPALLSGYKKIS